VDLAYGRVVNENYRQKPIPSTGNWNENYEIAVIFASPSDHVPVTRCCPYKLTKCFSIGHVSKLRASRATGEHPVAC
jgi:hypothetical protein